MNTQYELVELLSYLETAEIVPLNEIKTAIFDNLSRSKEPWLVNAVVDMFMASNSSRCLDVLVSLSDPHDKHLFDRLNDHMKGSQKAGAFAILAHLVQREPVWLHKIVSVPLLTTMLKTLKIETDGLILLMGALILTSLLPIVPVAIGPFMSDVCEVFSALATFCLNKLGNTPEVYLLHLQVGLHCVFHRLYSMYPVHFLTFLRTVYSRPDNMPVFDNVIKPMLSLVRMHPQLVTGSKDKELSRERWKEKEVHDIIVECAQLSLDPFDREFAESHLLSSWLDQRSQKFNKPDGNPEFPWNSLASVQTTVPGFDGTTSDCLSGTIWSPSKRSGLSTPPPGSNEPVEKVSQAVAQGAGPNTILQGSTISLHLMAEGAQSEHTSEGGIKLDDSLLDTGAKAAIAPPVLVEPPTPPDVRINDGRSPSSFFGVQLPADESVSSDDPAIMMQLTSSTSQSKIPVISTSLPEDSGPSEAETNAAEMAALVKKMKRIRLNSINVTRDLKSTVQISQSCPHLLSPYSGPHVPDDERLTSSQGSLDGLREQSSSDKWMGMPVRSSPPTKSSLDIMTSRVSPVAVTTVSTESQTGFYVFARGVDNVLDAEKMEIGGEDLTEAVLPYELQLGLLLPFAPFVQCYYCMRQHCDNCRENLYVAENQSLVENIKKCATVQKFGCITPLFMTCSPSYLLDQHVMRSSDLHNKVSDVKVATSTLQTKSVAYASSATDKALLRTQVLLMHNQMMFERHRQELHAKRNRRLLGRTVKVVSLEEQNAAMRDQLRLQESEMAKLRSDLQMCRRQIHDMEETISTKNSRISEMQRSQMQEADLFKQRIKELEESLISHKNSNGQLMQTLERTSNKLFSKEKDLEFFGQKVDGLSHLERQVIQLNTELLLMGELHQKYQQRLSEMSLSHNVQPQLQMCLDSCKAECQTLRSLLRQNALALEVADAQVEAMGSKQQKLEDNIATLKNLLETSQTLHLDHMQKLEERHKCEKKMQQTLQGRIFELQSEVELLKNHQPGRVHLRATHSSPTAAAVIGPDTSSAAAKDDDDDSPVGQQHKLDFILSEPKDSPGRKGQK